MKRFLLLLFYLESMLFADHTFSVLTWNVLGLPAQHKNEKLHRFQKAKEERFTGNTGSFQNLEPSVGEASTIPTVLTVIENFNADIVCLQEVSMTVDKIMEPKLTSLGYTIASGCPKGKEGGVIIYFKQDKFELSKNKDQHHQIIALELPLDQQLSSPTNKTSPISTSVTDLQSLSPILSSANKTSPMSASTTDLSSLQNASSILFTPNANQSSLNQQSQPAKSPSPHKAVTALAIDPLDAVNLGQPDGTITFTTSSPNASSKMSPAATGTASAAPSNTTSSPHVSLKMSPAVTSAALTAFSNTTVMGACAGVFLTSKIDGSEIFVCSLHLARPQKVDKATGAAPMMANELTLLVDHYLKKCTCPVILAGDFNLFETKITDTIMPKINDTLQDRFTLFSPIVKSTDHFLYRYCSIHPQQSCSGSLFCINPQNSQCVALAKNCTHNGGNITELFPSDHTPIFMTVNLKDQHNIDSIKGYLQSYPDQLQAFLNQNNDKIVDLKKHILSLCKELLNDFYQNPLINVALFKDKQLVNHTQALFELQKKHSTTATVDTTKN